MSFSQRYGHKPVREALQHEEIDDVLRASLWNVLEIFFWKHRRGYRVNYVGVKDIATLIWSNYLKEPLDTIPQWWDDTIGELRNYFFASAWYEVSTPRPLER